MQFSCFIISIAVKVLKGPTICSIASRIPKFLRGKLCTSCFCWGYFIDPKPPTRQLLKVKKQRGLSIAITRGFRKSTPNNIKNKPLKKPQMRLNFKKCFQAEGIPKPQSNSVFTLTLSRPHLKAQALSGRGAQKSQLQLCFSNQLIQLNLEILTLLPIPFIIYILPQLSSKVVNTPSFKKKN